MLQIRSIESVLQAVGLRESDRTSQYRGYLDEYDMLMCSERELHNARLSLLLLPPQTTKEVVRIFKDSLQCAVEARPYHFPSTTDYFQVVR